MQSWEITDGKRTTWTIAVHGNGAPRSELLRFVEPVIASGNAMLIINYRNDSDAPRSPDGYSHLGDTEWQDVQAAVAYAKSQGATKINLYGVSLGGSLVQNYLRQAPSSETAIVGKVILDSPALDWKAVLRHRIDQKGLPTILAGPGFRIATLRSGIDFDRISTMPGSITRPTLIIHSSDDDNVPNPPSKAVAAAQPDLVQLLDLQHGGHVRTWNFNPVRYEQAVRDFLGNDK
jgi:predicted alpha/beta-fold hydrolase